MVEEVGHGRHVGHEYVGAGERQADLPHAREDVRLAAPDAQRRLEGLDGNRPDVSVDVVFPIPAGTRTVLYSGKK